MAYHLRWRRAIIISVIFHTIFLGSVGWMTAKNFVSVDTEQYLEIQLVSEVEREEGLPNAVTAAASNQKTSEIIQKTAISTEKQSVPTCTAAVETEEISMVATEMTSRSGAIGGTGEKTSLPASGSVSAGTGKSTGGNSGAGIGTGRKSGGVAPPSILAKVDPIYPERARQAGRQGTVIVKIQILENGRPGNISIYRTSSYEELDNAAIAAVGQWRFVPAKDRASGEALVCYTTMPVSFRLN